ncbi:MAG TPA: hypothetical protein VGF99_15120 [Myxococcota bacterium]
MVSSCEGCRPSTDLPDEVFGHCTYVQRFSNREECREFRGTGWTTEDAQASCDEYDVALVEGPCDDVANLGACITSDDPELAIQLVIPGDDVEGCAGSERGCEVFGGGTWVPGNTCSGVDDSAADDVYDPDNYYRGGQQLCVDPVDGEPEGTSADGKVCTFNQISGCTEEGRHFEDYASCEDVRTQRPYGAVPPWEEPRDDPRLDDPTYAAEVDWVVSQIEACACVCCHKSSVAPEGAAIFDTEYAGNFANSFTDYGLAFAARVFDSSYLGNFDASVNNGFSRDVSGLPSTDQPRMKRFFEGELAHRGVDVSIYADLPPQPTIFFDQFSYEPQPCGAGEGVDADGTIRWVGGRARYLYVLEAGSDNPGVPPNLDKPEGTIWRVDTVPPAIPMKTGEVTYGELPEGTIQSVPSTTTAPAALVSGETYLLFALADIGVPMSRCLFTY